MLKKDFIEKNPLRVLSPALEGQAETGRMGLVMARAGVGKTAILVQIALDNLMRGKRVLHVSIGQNLDKTREWYYDIFRDIAEASNLEDAARIQEEILHNRLIMTFNEVAFTAAKFEERLDDLVSQNIFRPDCVLVDGLDFAVVDRKDLEAMRELLDARGLQAWFSAVCHREDIEVSGDAIPAPCQSLGDLLSTVILLQNDPEQKCMVMKVVKDDTGAAQSGDLLHLDPATLRIKP